jgi:cation:H+ antiporter
LSVYFLILLKNRNLKTEEIATGEDSSPGKSRLSHSKKVQLKRPILLFLAGLVGVIIAGNIVVQAAVYIARYFFISEIIIASTVIAIGTSLPEISTCITAARKGEGEIAVGNIIGADVLNILWIIGVSAVVRPIHVELNIVNFAFPYMILIVLVMLVSMRIKCRLGKIKGAILFFLYLVYLFLTIKLFV